MCIYIYCSWLTAGHMWVVVEWKQCRHFRFEHHHCRRERLGLNPIPIYVYMYICILQRTPLDRFGSLSNRSNVATFASSIRTAAANSSSQPDTYISIYIYVYIHTAAGLPLDIFGSLSNGSNVAAFSSSIFTAAANFSSQPYTYISIYICIHTYCSRLTTRQTRLVVEWKQCCYFCLEHLHCRRKLLRPRQNFFLRRRSNRSGLLALTNACVVHHSLQTKNMLSNTYIYRYISARETHIDISLPALSLLPATSPPPPRPRHTDECVPCITPYKHRMYI